MSLLESNCKLLRSKISTEKKLQRMAVLQCILHIRVRGGDVVGVHDSGGWSTGWGKAQRGALWDWVRVKWRGMRGLRGRVAEFTSAAQRGSAGGSVVSGLLACGGAWEGSGGGSALACQRYVVLDARAYNIQSL